MPSFKQKVKTFWETFKAEDVKIRELVDSDMDADEKVAKISEVLTILLEEPYFNIGYSMDNKKYELILSPEGNQTLLILLYYWYQQRDTSLEEHWNFFYTKPAVELLDGVGVEMNGIQLNNQNTKLYILPDSEKQVFDIQIYNSQLTTIETDQAYQILFIYLDLAFGERFVMEHIGSIDILSEDQAEAGTFVPSKVALQWATEIMEDENWQFKESPYLSYTGYRLEPNEENPALREDIYIGYTRLLSILNGYLQNDFRDILFAKKEGVDFGYLYFDNQFLSNDKVSDYRYDLEEEIIAVIESKGVGHIFGGATGYLNSYIDIVIFDKEEFFSIIHDIMIKLNIDVYYHDFLKEGESILVNTISN